MLVALGACPAWAAPADAPARLDAPSVLAAVVQRTNAFRSANGLGPLAVNTSLAAAAQRFADYMASTDAYAHDADGRQPAERARAQGYAFCAIAENIAYQFSSQGFSTAELVRRLVKGWEESPPHRHNMLLTNVIDIGVGVAQSPRTQRFYAVQLFGRPQSAAGQFELVNRSDAEIRYDMNGQTYSLPPRVTRMHQGCFEGPVKIIWPDAPGAPAFEPRSGSRYVVQRDSDGSLQVQAMQP